MDSREYERHTVHLEEIEGAFSLYAGEKQFNSMRINDVSVSGAGVLLSQPLAIGTTVRLTFSAGDWAVSVNGKIVWCRRYNLPTGQTKIDDNFRLGVQFANENIESNQIFFHASRTTLKAVH